MQANGSHAKKISPPLFSLRSVRFQMVILLAVTMIVGGLMRGSFGMAVVCMVDNNETYAESSSLSVTSSGLTDDTDVCMGDVEQFKSPPREYTKTYQVYWTSSEQSSIHASFYIGSLLSVLMLDKLVARHGAKGLTGFGLFLCSLGSILTPFLIIMLPHFSLAAIVRFMIGVGCGLMLPCGNVLVSRWFPVQEKSTAMAIYTTGNQVGIALAIFLTARSCELKFGGGWPISFIGYGIIGISFVLVWQLLASDKPRHSMKMSPEELEHITGKSVARSRAATVARPIPYRKIFLSPRIFAICLCAFAQSFVMIALVTYLPKYYQQSMKMDLSNNGISSAAPFVVQTVTKLVFALVADKLKERHIALDLITKAFNGLACFGTGLCILVISFLSCEHASLAVILMCTCMGVFSGFVPGYNTSIVSVAPPFTSTVSVLAQLYSQGASALAPLIIGVLTRSGTPSEWKLVFYILTALLFVAGVVFQFFGSAHAEPWALPSNRPSVSHVQSRRETVDREVATTEILLVPQREKRVSYRESNEVIPIPYEKDDALEDDEDEEQMVVVGNL